MRSIFKSWVFPMVLLCFGASTAWAAFGPCVIYRLKGLGPSQPIGCYKFWQNITLYLQMRRGASNNPRGQLVQKHKYDSMFRGTSSIIGKL